MTRLAGALSNAWRRHPKAMVSLAIALLAWLSLIAWLYFMDCPSADVQAWIEIANGATWATTWPDLCLYHHGAFALVVATRTALNFAAPLSVVGAGVWFLTGGLERAMKMSRQELMRMLGVEIVASLDALVRHNHPESYREGELDEMQKIVDAVVDGFLHDVEKLDKQDASTR
ncbi:MAG: hypothetical protein JNL87_01150 [Burkholderiaceae bacterium]|nr:hypothetical protein [Burkholderiaceae bacterium]